METRINPDSSSNDKCIIQRNQAMKNKEKNMNASSIKIVNQNNSYI